MQVCAFQPVYEEQHPIDLVVPAPVPMSVSNTGIYIGNSRLNRVHSGTAQRHISIAHLSKDAEEIYAEWAAALNLPSESISTVTFSIVPSEISLQDEPSRSA